ncbi:FecCD family ABC transporter permease [Neisseria perflava]|uniref:FecCD family ABC transporter permease n=1 Tax=Neisseria perflava TaxID=33053 RepID=UPI0020A15BF4|nr:iron ABC transporter permease [Neisseria perflava]MCP1659778.1 iron complex transport system permease protein [Neisseria perflava]MCP1771623.1 iron complex transport system permease protein [Neisseria perflava]
MKPPILIFSILLTLAAVYLCSGIGFGEWQTPLAMDETVRQIRLPRIYTALLVGAGLAASGAALQALFDNPLADPSLIGTSGGAALGVIVVLAFGGGALGVPLAAFLGALGVCLLILAVHRLMGGGALGLLVLGFVLSAFSGAVVSLILFLSDDLVLRSATTWLSGSLAEAGFTPPWLAAVTMAAGFLLLLGCGRRLDILMTGEDTAVSMGVSAHAMRVQTVIGAALMTGAAVSLAGIIGFLGMMVPNVLAQTVGGSRRKLIALSAWLGAVFLLVVDGAARWAAYPVDVPVGIIIALLGGPFFMYLFIKPVRK